MSYKKVLALTAFGVGVFLQGCGESEENEDADTTCANLVNYYNVEKAAASGGTNEEDKACSKCLAEFKGMPTTGANDLANWKLAVDAAYPGDDSTPSATVIALPLDALKACGAVPIITVCTDLGPILDNENSAAIQAAFEDAEDWDKDCGLCADIQVTGSSECSDWNSALDKCGGPDIVCDQDYSCITIDEYVDPQAGDAAVTACDTCLDHSDNANGQYDTLAADVTTNLVALVTHLKTCGAQQGNQCNGVEIQAHQQTYTSMSAEILADLTTAELANECVLCVGLGISDPTVASCSDYKTQLDNCDAVVTPLVCDACLDFQFGDAAEDCHKCLESASPGWDIPGNTEASNVDPSAGFNTKMGYVGTCGAVDTASAVCDTPMALAYNFPDGADGAAGFEAVFRTQAGTSNENACVMCVYFQLSELESSSQFTCAEWKTAIAACSDGVTQTSLPTGSGC